MRMLLLIPFALLSVLPVTSASALEIGAKAPDFELADTDGNTHHLADYLDAGKIVVLEWFNPDCPFIKKHHAANKTMNETRAAMLALDENVVWLAINSGAPGRQGQGLERNSKSWDEYEMPFPILIDESGKVGKLYGAKTTPHMFLIAADGTLSYQGAIDSSSHPTELGEINYVMAAFTEMVAGKDVTVEETKPYGCSVKYSK